MGGGRKEGGRDGEEGLMEGGEGREGRRGGRISGERGG